MSTSRQLAAILFADIEGFTALMEEDEVKANLLREKLKRRLEKEVFVHGGRIVKISGDGALCIFNSAIEAVRAAIGVQREMLENPKVPLRIGIHTGDVMYEEGDVFGDGVNVASRIQSFGVAGGILISGRVYDDIKNQKSIQALSFGMFELKNVNVPIEIFAISNEGLIVPRKEMLEGKGKKFTKNIFSSRKFLIRALIAIIILVLAIFLLNRYFPFSNNSGPEYTSIAVLPFENMSTEREDAYLADGICEEIRTQLSKILSLKVIARSSTKEYLNTSETAKQIGDELGASTLLTGSVQKQNDQLSVNVQLVDAKTNELIWSENFQRKATDVFAMQSEIAEQVAQQLKAKLTEEERKNIETAPTTNPLAYDYYLQAKNIFNTYDGPTMGQARRAVQFLDKALNLDPNFIKAVYFKATIFMAYHSYDHVIHRDTLLEKADSIINMMDAIAPDDPETKLAHAYYKASILGDLDGSLEIFNNYIKTNTNDAEVTYYIAYINMQLLKMDEAETMMKRAVELDPKNCTYMGQLSNIYRMQRDADNVIRTADKEMQLCSNDYLLAANIVYALMDFSGNISKARQLLDESPLKDHPDYAKGVRVQIYMLTGKIDSALQIIRTLPGDTITPNTSFYCHSFDLGYHTWLKGDTILARKYFAEAVKFLTKQIEEIPENANPAFTYEAYSKLGLSYAGLGNEKDCRQTFATLDNIDVLRKSKFHLVEVLEDKTTALIFLGKKDEAIANLQLLLQQPFNIMSTKSLYRLYPLYNSLRGDPRFQKMIR